MLDDELDLDLLQVIDNLAAGGFAGTEAIADAKFEADRAVGRNARRTSQAPYFGLDGPLRALERAEYIQIDPGVASFVPQGAPTPGPGEFYIEPTDVGREALANR